MKRQTPHIIVWEVCLTHPVPSDGPVLFGDQIITQREYFLFYSRAKAFVEKHIEELCSRGIGYSIGGKELWLW